MEGGFLLIGMMTTVQDTPVTHPTKRTHFSGNDKAKDKKETARDRETEKERQKKAIYSNFASFGFSIALSRRLTKEQLATYGKKRKYQVPARYGVAQRHCCSEQLPPAVANASLVGIGSVLFASFQYWKVFMKALYKSNVIHI